MGNGEELRRSLNEVLTSKEADVVWACAFAMLGGVTIFNALKEEIPRSIVFTLSGISLISLVPFFILRKSPKRIGDLFSMTVAFVSFLSPMLLSIFAKFSEVAFSNVYLCLGLYIIGIVMYYVSLTFLGDHFGVLPAFRGVSKRGPYALIRHPMYLGELLEFVGIVLAFVSFVTIMVLVSIIVLLILRIRLEEKVLMESDEYRKYALGTRYRFIPKIW